MIKVFNIIWDTEDNGEIIDVNLPSEIVLDNGVTEETVADWLSDYFGYCVKSFSVDKYIEYSFTFKVTGYKTIRVKANTYEEGEAIAKNEICDVDFGDLEDIDSDIAF